MYIYYILYSLLATSALLDFFIDRKRKRVVLWFWVIIISLFGGLRWNIGTDWNQYHDIFNHSSFSNIFNYYRGNDVYMESGFMFINALIHEIFGEFYIYNTIIEFFILSTIKYIGEKCSPYPLIFFAFLAVPGNTLTFAIRSGVAIATASMGYVKLLKEKWFAFIMITIIASSIHLAALIGFFIILAREIRINFWIISLAYLVAFIFSFVLRDYLLIIAGAFDGNIIAHKINSYSNYDSKGVEFRYSAHILNYILLIFSLFIVKKTSFNYDRWINVLLLSSLIFDFIQIIFGEEMYELKRLMGYFLVPRTLLLVNIAGLTKKYAHRYYLPYAIFLVMYLFYQVTKTCDGYYFLDECVPYRTIFD